MAACKVPQAFLNLGVQMACGAQGHFEAAVSDYSKAIAICPHHCRAFYNRAFSHERLRRWDAAIADYDRALQLEPTNATAYHNRCP